MNEAQKIGAWNELKNKINQLPFYPHMHMEITDLTDGYCRIEMRMSPNLQTTRKSLHGGAAAAIMDCANTMAANAAYVGEGLVLTVNLVVHYVRPGLNDLLVAEGNVVNKGRTLAFTEGKLFDPDTSKLIAKSSATCVVKTVGTYEEK